MRWVNRGAKGIALLDETGTKAKIRYVFDIKDTHMVQGGRSPYLWQLQEHQRGEVLAHLSDVYNLEEKDTADLADALMSVAKEMGNLVRRWRDKRKAGRNKTAGGDPDPADRKSS